MIIERRAGYINFQLENKDFDWDWRNFIKQLKEYIPLEQRKYNPMTKWWSIEEDETNSKVFAMLCKKYFEDENQEELEI